MLWQTLALVVPARARRRHPTYLQKVFLRQLNLRWESMQEALHLLRQVSVSTLRTATAAEL